MAMELMALHSQPLMLALQVFSKVSVLMVFMFNLHYEAFKNLLLQTLNISMSFKIPLVVKSEAEPYSPHCKPARDFTGFGRLQRSIHLG